MALALRTGIAPSVWAAEGEQAVVTALALLEAEDDDVVVEDDVPREVRDGGWERAAGGDPG